MPLPAAAPALYLRRRHEDRAKALKGVPSTQGSLASRRGGPIGGAQKAVDAISRPGRYPGSRSAAITPKTSINPGLKSGLGDDQGVDRSHLRKDAAIRPAHRRASARIKSLQTTLGAMPHSVLLGGYRLGVGLQDAAAAQETDGHRVTESVGSSYRPFGNSSISSMTIWDQSLTGA